MFNDQKLLQWFFGLLDVDASAIIMGWGVVEKREPEMGGCCVLSSLVVFFSVLFLLFARTPLLGVGLRGSITGREGGGWVVSYVPAIPTATAHQNHRLHCSGRDTRECDEH